MTKVRKAPFDRLLMLIRTLSESIDGLTLDEMAEALGQTRRSAERARDLISLHFDLDETLDGARKRFRIRDSLRRHYTRPTASELAALKSEIESLRPVGGARFRELASLLAKVQASFDDREKRRIEPDLELLLHYQRSFVGPGPRTEVDPEAWRATLEALMTGRCLEFDYLSAQADEPRWRKIACAGLLNGPITYVVGYMPHTDRPPVLYRMDRMQGVFVSDDPAKIPGDFQLDDWLADSFGIWREDSSRVVLRVLPSAAERARGWRFHPRQVVSEREDGGLTVSFRAGGLREIAEHLFGWAGELVIEEPSELKDVMHERLARAREMLGQSGES